MAAEHTPGPWKQDEVLTRCIVAVAKPRESLLMVSNAGHYKTPEGGMACFAEAVDARLAAAAPELLAALKALVEVAREVPFKHAEGSQFVREVPLSSLDAARAAIAKAEGRP